MSGLRKCEPCGRPGPCLWDPMTGRYACVGCHSDPADTFFKNYEPAWPSNEPAVAVPVMPASVIVEEDDGYPD